MSIDQSDSDLFILKEPDAACLARQLVHGVGNHQMRKATVLLAFFRNGYWLRRFTDESGLNAVEPADDPTSVNWTRVRELLTDPDLLDDPRIEPGSMAPHLAILGIAASLAAGHPVDLRQAALQLPGTDWRRAMSVMASAADFM
ncbi:hypothetical protein ABZ383_33780 [Streptomyces sp. NPDC005900]|uniref:hypothetical protein n=1 Tax=Streptomyces sp. NPDC005900 TaxID=3154569 RepID=UPI0033D19873